MASSPPRIAVITPYYKESAQQLERCVNSVLSQTMACGHFLISDGHPRIEALQWPVRHIQLGVSHQDFGDTPRAVGSLLAISEGFDAICYLDADNYLLPDHIASVSALWESHDRQLDVITSERFFVYPDGRQMPIRELAPTEFFCDTNCLFLAADALPLTPLWSLMPSAFHALGDRVLWCALQAAGLRIAHLPQQSVAYTSNWRAHYQQLGENPPPDAKDISPAFEQALHWWFGLAPAERQRQQAILRFDPGPMLQSLFKFAPPKDRETTL